MTIYIYFRSFFNMLTYWSTCQPFLALPAMPHKVFHISRNPTGDGSLLQNFNAIGHQCSHHIETSQMIWRANQLTGLYKMGRLVQTNCVDLSYFKVSWKCLRPLLIKNSFIVTRALNFWIQDVAIYLVIFRKNYFSCNPSKLPFHLNAATLVLSGKIR